MSLFNQQSPKSRILRHAPFLGSPSLTALNEQQNEVQLTLFFVYVSGIENDHFKTAQLY